MREMFSSLSPFFLLSGFSFPTDYANTPRQKKSFMWCSLIFLHLSVHGSNLQPSIVYIFSSFSIDLYPLHILCLSPSHFFHFRISFIRFSLPLIRSSDDEGWDEGERERVECWDQKSFSLSYSMATDGEGERKFSLIANSIPWFWPCYERWDGENLLLISLYRTIPSPFSFLIPFSLLSILMSVSLHHPALLSLFLSILPFLSHPMFYFYFPWDNCIFRLSPAPSLQ